METGTGKRPRGIRSLRPNECIPESAPSKRYINRSGYVAIRWKLGPYNYVETLEHRIVDGRITDAEAVHHINGNKSDNRPENLAFLTSSEHSRLHGAERRGDYDEAERLYNEGYSTPEIGKIINRDASNVYRRLSERGVSFRDSGSGRRLELDRERIVDLFLSGMRPRDIGTLLGVSDTPIRRILREEGIPAHRPGRPLH